MDDKELIFQFIHSSATILALNLIIDKRINELKDQLVIADLDRVKGIQGSIEELKRFKKIKEIITSEVKNNGK